MRDKITAETCFQTLHPQEIEGLMENYGMSELKVPGSLTCARVMESLFIASLNPRHRHKRPGWGR